MLKRVFVCVLIAVLFLTGCSTATGKAAPTPEPTATNTPVPTSTPTLKSTATMTPTPEPTATPEPTPTPEPTATPVPAAEGSTDVVDTTNTETERVLSSFEYKYGDKKDDDRFLENMRTDTEGSQIFDGTYVEVLETPYYVGRQESSFLKSVEGQYDETLFLNEKLYVGNADVTISDETVAEVSNGLVVPLKQGLFTLAKDGESRRYAVTTYNDGRYFENLLTLNKKQGLAYDFVNDAEYWQQCIKTPNDFAYYMLANSFCYTNNEPQTGWYGNGWVWCADPVTIHEYGQGVCAEIAQLANYMLKNDFEDWGTILETGKSGHIYNYFYEDGYYYIYDFTGLSTIINDESYEKNDVYYDELDPLFYKGNYFKGKFKTLEDIQKKYDKDGLTYANNKVSILLISNMGHDYYAINYTGAYNHPSDNFMDRLLQGKEKEKIYFEEILKDHIEVIYMCDGFSVEFIPTDAVPMALRVIRTACYGPRLVRIK